MIYTSLQSAHAQGEKQLAVLIDPDKTNRASIIKLAEIASYGGVNYFFWGGSLVNEVEAEYYLSLLQAHTELPIILFPGNTSQLSNQADGLLFLSMISGRNPELLIGQHVIAAPRIKRMDLEIIPTGYMHIDGGCPTAVGYMSNTQPIPANKPGIAKATALAGMYLGLKTIYLDAGSGAKNAVPEKIIAAVREEINIPLIVGGGITTAKQAEMSLNAGADLIVVGNSLETDPELLPDLANVIKRSRIFS